MHEEPIHATGTLSKRASSLRTKHATGTHAIHEEPLHATALSVTVHQACAAMTIQQVKALSMKQAHALYLAEDHSFCCPLETAHPAPYQRDVLLTFENRFWDWF